MPATQSQTDEIRLTHVLSPEELLWFLSRGFDDVVYRVDGNSVYRAFKFSGEMLLIKTTPTEYSIHLEWLRGTRTKENAAFIKSFIIEWFDLQTDLKPFYALLIAHDQLHYMAGEFAGLTLVGMPDLFEALAWAIIGQQINLTFAYKIKRRLVERYGEWIDFEDSRYYLFPSPEVLAVAEIDDLKASQLSGSKAAYLKIAAAAFASGTINKTVLKALPDMALRRNLLTAQKGIGTWTANYVLMKSLRDPSAIPYGDAGLLNALLSHGIIPNKTELDGMHRLFEKFSGWEAYLVFYLWRSLAVKKSV